MKPCPPSVRWRRFLRLLELLLLTERCPILFQSVVLAVGSAIACIDSLRIATLDLTQTVESRFTALGLAPIQAIVAIYSAYMLVGMLKHSSLRCMGQLHGCQGLFFAAICMGIWCSTALVSITTTGLSLSERVISLLGLTWFVTGNVQAIVRLWPPRRN